MRQVDQRRRLPGPLVLGAVTALVSVGFATLGVAQADDPPAVDEIVHSQNVHVEANIPKVGPLTDYYSDMAFKGNYLFQGSYDGFTVYDISHPKRPRVVSRVNCPGGQGDVSVAEHADLLFFSVDFARTSDQCDSAPGSTGDPNAWEGIRIFDISDVTAPRQIAAVRTDCGSHTHTMVPAKTRDKVYLYVSSYSPNPAFPHCQPPHDSISIVEVPLRDPAAASVVATPTLFPGGGNTRTSGCHDITVYPDRDLAGGACMGDGVLLDIADRVHPKVIADVQDPNFAFWHSATFSNDGRKVIFTDELGGGAAPTCNAEVGPDHGADAIYDITGSGDSRTLSFDSYYKMPRPQTDNENCVAHNGNLVPVHGRDVLVQAWYQGGVSVVDFTDAAQPKEVGYFERGPLSDTSLVLGGSWSAYYYNGYVYSSDIQKGLDVLKLTGSLASADGVKLRVLNAQTQYQYRN